MVSLRAEDRAGTEIDEFAPGRLPSSLQFLSHSAGENMSSKVGIGMISDLEELSIHGFSVAFI